MDGLSTSHQSVNIDQIGGRGVRFQIMMTPLIEIGVATEKVRARLVPVLVVVIETAIVIAIVAIREKEIALIGLRKTIDQSLLENSLNNPIHEC